MEDKFKKNTHCQYCGKDIKATYRSKRFCSDKCRVYFGRQSKVTTKTQVQNLNEPTNDVKPKINYNKKNYTINTSIPPMPEKKDFDSTFDFGVAKSEWKEKYNK